MPSSVLLLLVFVLQGNDIVSFQPANEYLPLINKVLRHISAHCVHVHIYKYDFAVNVCCKYHGITFSNSLVICCCEDRFLDVCFLQVYNALIESTKAIKGASVEHNKFCVTVHFRRVKEEVCPVLSYVAFLLVIYEMRLLWTTVNLQVIDFNTEFIDLAFNLNLVNPFLFVMQYWESLAERVGCVLKDFPTLSLTHGRKVCY